jgi:hypothetical protein
VGFVIILFQPFFAVFFPVFTTLNISSSAIPRTLGKGTENFAAFSALTRRGQPIPRRGFLPDYFMK